MPNPTDSTEPPNPFAPVIEAFLSSTKENAADETASNIVSIVTNSEKPDTELWHFWKAFFESVATSSSFHTPLKRLLKALKEQEPTIATKASKQSDTEQERIYSIVEAGRIQWNELPYYYWIWRDYDAILDGNRSAEADTSQNPSSINNKRYLRFCAFSASLLKEGIEVGASAAIYVFYGCREVLECHGPRKMPDKTPLPSLWDTDVQIAAVWARDGATSLWNTDSKELRQDFATPLDHPTDLWPRTDGLTRERWQLWRDRLHALSTNSKDCHGDEGNLLSEETKAVAAEAVAVLNKLLGDKANE